MFSWRTALVLVAGLSLAAGDKDQAVQKEMSKLEGTWTVVRQEQRGNLVPPVVSRRGGLLIEDGTLKWLVSGREAGNQTADFAIDPTKSPKTIDIEITRGSFIGKKQLGIYRLNGDKLEVCWGDTETAKRPTKFTTKAGIGSGFEYTVYKRNKD
ncbi:MAG TPA: TIGR03067 domain-containing protein [Gemmataceae bacterium]|nr:TIGR03067 domain-containing protein [Gemmataceae bacterium]